MAASGQTDDPGASELRGMVLQETAMSQKKAAQPKHVPVRMCIGCREALAKRALVRVVRGPDGIRIDPSGKASGRGAYIHNQRTCWEKALGGALAHALKTEISTGDRDALVGYMSRLDPGPQQKPDPATTAGGTA
jgi:predicted RNA-binding protein YlxR (DUF448 family)